MHLIKTSVFIALAILLAACIKDPYRSPYIQVTNIAINSDTIESTETPVPIGDTLQISMSLQGFVNNLEYFQITMDRDYAKDSIDDTETFLEYCNPLYTRAKDGLYSFNPGINNMYLTLFIIPKRTKDDEKEKVPVTLSIKSDCNTGDETNPYTIGFSYYITNKK